MRPVRLFVLLSLVQFLWACAQLPFFQQDMTAQVDSWVANQEYGKALGAFRFISEQNPDYARLKAKKAEVLSKAGAYEVRVVREAERLVKRGQWEAALDSYQQALRNYPDGQRLQQGFKALKHQQEVRLDELQLELTLARAKALEQHLPVLNDIVEVSANDWQASHNLRKHRREAADITRRLTVIGASALDRGDIALAKRTLPIASRLHPNSETEAANQRLERALIKQTRRKRAVAQRRESDKLQKLTVAFEEAFEAGDLPLAQRLMARLEGMEKNNAQIQQYRKQLNMAIETQVRTYMNEGIAYYSQGHFEKAIASWTNVSEIEPDNEQAQIHIERAERVLQKLRELRAKQQKPHGTEGAAGTAPPR